MGRWVLVFVSLTLTVLGAGVVFVVADDLAGRVAAVVSVIAILLVPLSAGVVSERIALVYERELRAERLALWLLPLFSVGCAASLCSAYPSLAGPAFSGAPRRYEMSEDGLMARAMVAFGDSLFPPPPPRSPPRPRRRPAEDAGDLPTPDASAEPVAPLPSPPSAPPPPAVPRGRFSAGDTSYSEPVTCATLPDVASARSAHVRGNVRPAAEALARLRYPTGLPFLEAQKDSELAVWFAGGPDSFEGVGQRLDTAIHEGSHFWVFKRFNPRTVTYPLHASLTIEARRLKNFNRSEILAHHVEPQADSYARIYLQGASGAQGFNSLLDEYNAYAHSLASRYCMRDLMAPRTSISARDGILTMMYYVEVYLWLARTQHPADYAAILADAGTRRLVVTVWDRAEYWLRASAPMDALGIDDRRVERWVYQPDRLAEIARVRAAR